MNTLQRILRGELVEANDDAPPRTTRAQRWLALASFVVAIGVGMALATCVR